MSFGQPVPGLQIVENGGGDTGGEKIRHAGSAGEGGGGRKKKQSPRALILTSSIFSWNLEQPIIW